MSSANKLILEEPTLLGLGNQGYLVLSGPDIAPGDLQAERDPCNLFKNATEQIALDELQALGWKVAFGSDIAFDGPRPEQDPAANHSNVVSTRRLCPPDVEKILEEL